MTSEQLHTYFGAIEHTPTGDYYPSIELPETIVGEFFTMNVTHFVSTQLTCLQSTSQIVVKRAIERLEDLIKLLPRPKMSREEPEVWDMPITPYEPLEKKAAPTKPVPVAKKKALVVHPSLF